MSNRIAPVTYTYEDGQTVRLLASGTEVRVTVDGLVAEWYPKEVEDVPTWGRNGWSLVVGPRTNASRD